MALGLGTIAITIADIRPLRGLESRIRWKLWGELQWLLKGENLSLQIGNGLQGAIMIVK